MGDHYVPKYYLRGFSLDAQNLWAFDKKQGRRFATQVKSIANETEFYSPTVENYLANTIEGPANRVLDTIRARSPLSLQDREVLSAYMTCMLKRVPRGLARFKEFAPSIAQKVGDRFEEQLAAAAESQPQRVTLFEQRKNEVREILNRFSRNPPKDVWLANLPPDKSPRVLTALSRMTWQLFTFDRYPAFLTSDNPVFYFSDLGIGNAESEVTFPISSNVVLWATWRGDLPEGYFPTRDSIVKEINRRTASITTRYAFHAIDESWVLSLLNRSHWRLKRLR